MQPSLFCHSTAEVLSARQRLHPRESLLVQPFEPFWLEDHPSSIRDMYLQRSADGVGLCASWLRRACRLTLCWQHISTSQQVSLMFANRLCSSYCDGGHGCFQSTERQSVKECIPKHRGYANCTYFLLSVAPPSSSSMTLAVTDRAAASVATAEEVGPAGSDEIVFLIRRHEEAALPYLTRALGSCARTSESES